MHEFEYLHVLGFSREITNRIYKERNAFIMSNWLTWLWRLSCPKIYRVSEQAENPRELMVLFQLKANRLKIQEELISQFKSMCVGELSCFSCVQLFAAPWTIVCQGPLSMEFSKQEYWSGLPFPSPGDLPNPGIKPDSVASPALASGFLTISTPWEVHKIGIIFLLMEWSAFLSYSGFQLIG